MGLGARLPPPHPQFDGLVRLCTEPYSEPTPENLTTSKMHLANWSVNKIECSQRVDESAPVVIKGTATDPAIITRARRQEVVRKKLESDSAIKAAQEQLRDAGVDPKDGGGLKRSLVSQGKEKGRGRRGGREEIPPPLSPPPQTWLKRFIGETAGGNWDAIEASIDSLVAQTLTAAVPDLAHKYVSLGGSNGRPPLPYHMSQLIGQRHLLSCRRNGRD